MYLFGHVFVLLHAPGKHTPCLQLYPPGHECCPSQNTGIHFPLVQANPLLHSFELPQAPPDGIFVGPAGVTEATAAVGVVVPGEIVDVIDGDGIVVGEVAIESVGDGIIVTIAPFGEQMLLTHWPLVH